MPNIQCTVFFVQTLALDGGIYSEKLRHPAAAGTSRQHRPREGRKPGTMVWRLSKHDWQAAATTEERAAAESPCLCLFTNIPSACHACPLQLSPSQNGRGGRGRRPLTCREAFWALLSRRITVGFGDEPVVFQRSRVSIVHVPNQASTGDA